LFEHLGEQLTIVVGDLPVSRRRDYVVAVATTERLQEFSRFFQLGIAKSAIGLYVLR
jgi:hypothetical protein